MLNSDIARQQSRALEDIFQFRRSTNLQPSIPLILKLNPKIFDALGLPEASVINCIKQGSSFYAQVIRVLERIHNTLGVPQPQFQIVAEDSLGYGEFLIQIQERIIYRDKAEIGHSWTTASEDLLRLLEIPLARQARHPITGFPVAWIRQDYRSKLENLGVLVKELPEYILFILSAMASKFSDHFLDCDEILKLLESIKQNNNKLASRLDQSAVRTDEVESILKYLLRHMVSIINLEEILEEIIAQRTTNKDLSINAIAEHLFSKFKSDQVLLEISPQIAELINSNQLKTDDPELVTESKINKELLPLMYDELFYELGVYIPRVKIKVVNELAPDTFRVRVNQVLRTTEKVALNYQLLNCSHEKLEREIQGTLSPPKALPAINPANGNPATWISNDQEEIINSELFDKWDIAGYFILSLAAVLRRCAAEFIGIDEVEYAIKKIDQFFPKLRAIVKQKFTIDQITVVLRNLVREGISIKDLRLILELMTESDLIRQSTFALSSKDYSAALEFPYGINDLIALTEYVRQGLKLYISHKYTYAKRQSTLTAYLLDPEVESLIKRNINKTEFGSSLKLDNVDVPRILKAINKELDFPYLRTRSFVILTDIRIRPHLQQLLTAQFPHLHVLSYQELSPSTSIQPIARIKF